MYISNISISLIIAISPCVESLLVAANFCFWDKDFFSDFSGCWSQCGRSFSQPALTCCVVSIRPLLTHCCVYCQLSGGLTKLWGIANLLHHLVEWRGTKTTHANVFLLLPTVIRLAAGWFSLDILWHSDWFCCPFITFE